MPEGTPVTAPAAAPVSAPSTSAPVSAPASTPAAEPSATSSAPVESTPAAVPTGDGAPAAEKPGKPERSAYGENDIEKFLKDTYAWEEENPDGTQLVTGDEISVEGEAAPPAEETKAPEAEAEKPADETKTPEVEAPTPEGLSKLMEEHPDFKAAIDAAAPAVKGALYAMARQNAKAAPILEVFPNVEAAKFASDNANQFVSLKTSFMLSDSPEKMKDAAGMFLEQFQITDDKGQPVLDPKGNPTYGEDLPLFVSEIKNRDTTARIDDIKARIEAGQYGSEEGKENDEQLLAAYEFIQTYEAADPADLDKPDTSKMDPDTKAYFEKKESELAAERERLGVEKKNLTTKQKAEVRDRNDRQYREKFGDTAGKFMSKYLEQKEKDGVAIPHYMLTMKDPKTGVSVFAMTAFNRLNEKLGNLTDVKSHSATLQMNALTNEGLAARVSYGQELIDLHLPDVIDEILTEAGVSIAKDAANKIANRDARRSDARVEPSGGGTIIPKGSTPEQIYAKAKENVRAAAKGAYIAPDELMRRSLIERDRLEAQR